MGKSGFRLQHQVQHLMVALIAHGSKVPLKSGLRLVSVLSQKQKCLIVRFIYVEEHYGHFTKDITPTFLKHNILLLFFCNCWYVNRRLSQTPECSCTSESIINLPVHSFEVFHCTLQLNQLKCSLALSCPNFILLCLWFFFHLAFIRSHSSFFNNYYFLIIFLLKK